MTPDRLGLRALNRATLHRQLLLDRAAMTAHDAVRHLAGLQAQAPLAPYVGLWTRLAGFRHQDLKDLLTERTVLRAHLMRNTVHLVDAEDFVRFRPLYQPLLGRHLAELLDLPDAPRPDPDVPAPPRFLPEYDNLLLSYAERSRVIPHRRPVPLPPGHGATGGTLLVDGVWQADWKIVKGALEIEPFIQLSASDRDAVAAEGERLLGFATPAIAVRDVRFAPVRSG